jgi:hypothetical protein
MSLRKTDTILIDSEAIAYIEAAETAEGTPLAKCEIVEYFFDWLKIQPRKYQLLFLKEALSE